MRIVGVTLKTLKQYLLLQFGFDVSISTINKCISSFSYTFKRIHLLPQRRNDPDVILERRLYATEFVRLFSSLNDSFIYFIDEVGYNVSMRSKSGRSLRGTTPVSTVPQLRSRNISVCCAMNKDTIIGYKADTRS
ncbi:hypothetical protein ENBRE01_1691 [Enteropsectra breve]|nr:hypothetical protein ENBRE01_1691 [Enteropsectra breve]